MCIARCEDEATQTAEVWVRHDDLDEPSAQTFAAVFDARLGRHRGSGAFYVLGTRRVGLRQN